MKYVLCSVVILLTLSFSCFAGEWIAGNTFANRESGNWGQGLGPVNISRHRNILVGVRIDQERWNMEVEIYGFRPSGAKQYFLARAKAIGGTDASPASVLIPLPMAVPEEIIIYVKGTRAGSTVTHVAGSWDVWGDKISPITSMAAWNNDGDALLFYDGRLVSDRPSNRIEL